MDRDAAVPCQGALSVAQNTSRMNIQAVGGRLRTWAIIIAGSITADGSLCRRGRRSFDRSLRRPDAKQACSEQRGRQDEDEIGAALVDEKA